MKKNFLISLLSGFSIIGCSPGDSPSTAIVTPVTNGPVASEENVSALAQQFHGKYKLISSVSNEPVDINLDGKASLNLQEEITELSVASGTKYNVEVRIYGPSVNSPKSSFLFIQWWPEQFIETSRGKVWDGGEVLSYNPNYVVKYDFQGSFRSFSFSPDLKQITVKSSEPENAYRWVRPELVNILNNSQLEIITKRRLYTREGVREVTITSLYERFTTMT